MFLLPCENCLYNGLPRIRDHGSTKARFIFVFEYPLNSDIRVGKGPSGRTEVIFNNILKFLEIKKSDVVVAYSVKCPAKSDSSINDAVRKCRRYIEKTISLIPNKKLIVCIGSTPIKQITRGKLVKTAHGRFFWSQEFQCWVFGLSNLHHMVVQGTDPAWPWISKEKMKELHLRAYNEIHYLKEFIQGGFIVPKQTKGTYSILRDSQLINSEGFAFDIEWNVETGVPIAISFSSASGSASVIKWPFNEDFMKRLKYAMSNPNIFKVVANRPVDELKLEEYTGISVKGKVFDVFTMAHLLDENQQINLENLANTYTNLRNIKDLALGKRKSLDDLTDEQFVLYSGIDADATFRLYRELSKRLKKEPKILNYYANFILPVEDMLAKVTRNGCKIDVNALKESISLCESEIVKYETSLLQRIPKSILDLGEPKLTRNRLIIDYLFKHKDGLRLRSLYLTPTGMPCVNEKHLREHLNNDPELEWIEDFLEWKKLIKIKNTYLDPMFDYIQSDGRIYPHTLLYRTVTGRTAIIDPPIQQIPQRGKFVDLVRRIFVADDGWILGARDLAQSEVRIMAWLANEEKLLGAIMKNIDIHRLTASLILNKKLEEVTKEDRQKAKSVIFGFLYGMSAESFVDYAKTNYNLTIPLEVAQEFREKFFGTYKSILRYHRIVKNYLSQHGYIYSPLGRRRLLPDAQSPDPFLRSRAERQGINFCIQSFSSDLALISMKLFQDSIETNERLKGKVKLLWFIHDSIFFQAKEEIFGAAMIELERCMRVEAPKYIKEKFGITVGYPVESDGKAGKSWAEMKEI